MTKTTAPAAPAAPATFTKGQRVMITRGHDKGKIGTVYAILGRTHIIKVDGQQEAASVRAPSLKAI